MIATPSRIARVSVGLLVALAPVGCSLASGLDDFAVGPASTVGNCAVDGGEACDDCNAVSGDGCSETGAVEPGWHCDVAGDPCLRLTGFVEGDSEVIRFGGNGGTDFNAPCPAGELLIGFDGHADADVLYTLRSVCAVPLITETGGLSWEAVGTTTGFVGGDHNGTIGERRCPEGMFVTGLASSETTVIEGVAVHCGDLVFDDGDVSRSEETTLDFLGSSDNENSYVVDDCAADALIRDVTGREGARVDRLDLACASLRPTYCGDGMQEGIEACDDGNTVADDGCSPTCDGP